MYEYKTHEADIGILVKAPTLEEAFCDGARAMFGVMVEISSLRPERRVPVRASGNDIPSLFVNFLNELLSQKDIEDFFFGDFEVKRLWDEQGVFWIEAEAIGEPLDPKRHELRTEVKAATFHGIRYEHTTEGYILQCVLDV